MLFPTLTFAVFFAVVFGLNWGLAALAERHAGCERGFVLLRKLVLLAASLVFYGWWSWPVAPKPPVHGWRTRSTGSLCLLLWALLF